MVTSKFQKAILTALIVGAALTASSAFALVAGQVQVGKRWAEFEPGEGQDKYGAQATEMVASVHVDPIPLVPVSAGASLALQTWNAADFNAKTAAGSELGLEVMAWVPMVPFLTPYAKLRYVVMGKILTEGEVTETNELTGIPVTSKTAAQRATSGFHLNLGAKFSVLPLVSVLVELGNGFGEAQLEEYKKAGVKETLSSDAKKADKMNSRALLIGVEVGI